jgi:hypothetical protein
MDAPLNPFHENYITETTTPTDFVDVFSPLHLSETLDTLALFQPGNVVLTGVQGSGKSMLLALLRPDIRIAYLRKPNVRFPVPEQFTHFVGAGINLTRSGASDFGQRSLPDANWPLYCGDFLNYWIVRDILASLGKLSSSPLGDTLGLSRTSEALNSFAVTIARHPCWFGYLDAVHDFPGLQEALTTRITAYRSFLNYNGDMPDRLSRTKTSVGEPVSMSVEYLRQTGIVPDHVEFYVRIDQYEELLHLEQWSRKGDVYHEYRAIIHKLLGRRDPRVSYRIGTRSHAWPDAPRMFATAAKAEELRNFKRVDIDDILRRHENRPWLFCAFADDVFRRRLEHGGYQTASIQDVFGKPKTPEEKAVAYAGSNFTKVLVLEAGWPQPVRDILNSIVKTDPLNAKLGEAWIRQQVEKRDPRLPAAESLPWEEESKQWWRKERIDQALLQIAARRQQKMEWAGDDEILGLAAGNILAFVDLCQYIWAAWLRSLPERHVVPPEARHAPRILNQAIQNEGIQQVSSHWYRKIRSEQRGDSRLRFVTNIGNQFRTHLREDVRMSYPGFNGFSVPLRELDEDTEVAAFLREAEGYGVLVGRSHTSRTKGRGECRKWYLHPILSPHFQIPLVHTKEPMEVHVRIVRDWLVRSDVFRAKSDSSAQPTLFYLQEEE